ncbi:MAG: NAD(P)H-dependent glycerol-3-phosphate dehydrogenase [Eubacteriales bacterium]
MEDRITILGAGSWGTALAISLSSNGRDVNLWGRNSDRLEEIISTRENIKYLPGIKLDSRINIIKDMQRAIENSNIIVCSVASQAFRPLIKDIKPYLKEGSIIVNTAKGIERESHMRLSEVAAQEIPKTGFVALSGPSHAEEVSRGMPTTLVSASEDILLAQRIQDIFMSNRLRIYTNPDVIGVELGGALKNIIALGAGISDGMGFGDNAKAAMMTRGITEISRLGIRMGAKQSTFSGLSGIGDLIVTCTSLHSRNRRCGMLIGQGVRPDDAIKEIGMVVEGVFAAGAAYELSKEMKVELPITEQIYYVLREEITAKDAVIKLMGRGKKHEEEEIL